MANNDPMQIDVVLQATDPLNVSLGEMYKGGDGSFAGLSDVALDNPTNGQVPKYNAETEKWENADDNTVSNLTDLEDVNISNPTDGQIVRYDAETDKFIASDEQVGSDVSITQVQTTGTKIATVSVDEQDTDLYAPSPTSVSVTQTQTEGTKVGEITVNGQTTELFAPTPTSPTSVSVTQIQSTGTKIATIGVNGTDTDLFAPEGGGGGSSTFAGLDDVDFNNLQNGQVPMYDSVNSEWINGEIKLGTKTAFSVPINLASKTGSGLVQTFFTYTADNDQFLNVVTTGTTDCGSNDAYISLSKNGTAVERYTLITNTATTHNFAQLNLMEGDTITLKFGWVNNHGAKLNGTANFLSIVGSPRLQPVIYSTAEREIGVWVDGKPLYEKTFIFTTSASVSANSWSDTPISNDGIEKTIYCVAYDIATGTSYDYLACGKGSGSYVRVLNVRNAALSYDGLTLRYTKTADTAGSGQWTPQGVPAVHYSTDEQVVGTWIDGSTLYEKTFYSDMTISYDNASAVTLNDTIPSNIEVVDIHAYFKGKVAGGNQVYQSDGGKWFNYYYEAYENKIYASQIFASAGVTNCKTYFTIRYTKSS